MRPLTELEALVLAHIWRDQPVTAYRVRQLMMTSLLGKLADSKGSIYPVIKRLTEQGLVDPQAVSTGERPSSQLIATMRGEDALREWIFALDPGALASPETLRLRAAFLACLRPSDRKSWFDLSRDLLTEELANARSRAKLPENDDRFLMATSENVILTLQMQLKWLKLTRERLISRSSPR